MRKLLEGYGAEQSRGPAAGLGVVVEVIVVVVVVESISVTVTELVAVTDYISVSS